MSWEEAAGSGWYPSAGPEYSLSQPVGTPGEAAAVDSERGGAGGGGRVASQLEFPHPA